MEAPIKFDPLNDKTGKISVVIVDDHPLVRFALSSLLKNESDIEVLAEASDGESAVKLVLELKPDVVVMDITLPKLNGLEATKQIKEKCPDIAILILTVHSDSEHIFGIFEAGAAGYLTKSVFGEEVIQAIRGIHAGGIFLSPTILSQLLKHAVHFTNKASQLDGREKLNVRELEILKLTAFGLGNKDIAQKLGLSTRTIKKYFGDIFSKLRVATRTEAVIIGLRAGLFTLEDLE
jgi:NarL family two-component system response regulator LiaR